jgi:phosphoribosylanthranilate isomerase
LSVRIKICGITNLDDALAAIEAGADALGFVFCEDSPRNIPLPLAARLLQALPPFIARVGVFANLPEQSVREVIGQCGIDTLQFHGDEPPELCRRFELQVVKAFRVRDEHSLRAMVKYKTAAWLLDSYLPGKLGGTGERFNWDLARQAIHLGNRVILAGGLTPANVAEAVRQVRPYAVDVSSGVERVPGRKDHQKVRDFIRAAKFAIE